MNKPLKDATPRPLADRLDDAVRELVDAHTVSPSVSVLTRRRMQSDAWREVTALVRAVRTLERELREAEDEACANHP